VKRAIVLWIGLFAILLNVLSAQQRPQAGGGISAGGKWMEFDTKDPMTDANKTRFELEADNLLNDSSDNKPRIDLFCKDNGKGSAEFASADFVPNVRLGPPNRPGFWGQPQLSVRVRADEKHSDHGWNWENGSFLKMDKGTVRDLIGAKIFRVEFRTPSGLDIAEFSPAGFNLDRVRHACDLKPR
jgi:hypothetical protein